MRRQISKINIAALVEDSTFSTRILLSLRFELLNNYAAIWSHSQVVKHNATPATIQQFE